MAALGFCAPPSATPPSSKASPQAVTLSSQAPVSRLPISLRGAVAVDLSITRIVNPSAQPVSVRAELAACEGGQSRKYELGVATPYPQDQTGVFVLPIPSGAKAQLASCGGTAAVTFTLVPVRDAETLGPGIVIAATVRAR